MPVSPLAGINAALPSTRMKGAGRLLRSLLAVGLLSCAGLSAAAELVVDTPLDQDDGSGVGGMSLRDAIAEADAGDSLVFDDALFSGGAATLTLDPLFGDLMIDKQLTIAGPGSAQLTLSGGNARRLFHVVSGGLELSGMTLADGLGRGGDGGDGSRAGGGGGLGAGGAIFIFDGTVVASDVSFRDNAAVGGNGGNSAGNNYGAGGGGGSGDGRNADGVDASSSHIGGAGGPSALHAGASGGTQPSPHQGSSGDPVTGGGGGGGGTSDFGSGAGGNGGFGGGGGASGTASSSVTAASADGDGGDGGFGGGGGAAGWYFDVAFPQIGGTGGDFAGDGAAPPAAGGVQGSGGGGGAGLGGAVFVNATASFTCTACSFIDNSATGGTGGIGVNGVDGGAGQGKGGAVFLRTGGTVVLVTSQFTGNWADDAGGVAGDDDNLFGYMVPVSLTTNTGTVAESGGQATITAILDAAESVDVTVTLAFSGQATAVSDYTSSAGSILITAGNTTGSVTLTGILNEMVEGNESLVIDIAAVAGGSAVEDGVQQVTLSIIDYVEPPLPSYGGSLMSVDLSGPLEILPGAVIDGGTLRGDIYNAGLITGSIMLGAGTMIDGGTVSGTLTGDPGSPALLRNVTLPAGTRLENVVIGTGNDMDPGVVLAGNVSFTPGVALPPGIELTALLNPFSWTTSEVIEVVDLGIDVVGSPGGQGGGILGALQLLDDYEPAGNEILQNADGELEIITAESRSVLLPVRVWQAAQNETPGTYIDQDGNILLVTAGGRVVLAWQVLAANDFFIAAMAARGLPFSYDAGGRLILAPPEAPFYFAGRPAASAVPAFRSEVPGFQAYPLDLANTSGFSVIFADPNGVLMEQDVAPVPANWPALADTLWAVPGMSDVSIDTEGLIAVMLNGTQLRGRTAYQVFRGTNGSGAGGAVVLQAAGDLNGDGAHDLWLLYANGDRQALYLYP